MSFSIFSSIIPKFFSKKTAQQSKNWSTSTGTYITFMSDFLKNIRTVLNYNALDTFIKKGQKIITQSTENKRLRDNTIAKSNFWVNIFVYSFDFLPIGIGIIMVIKGMLSLIHICRSTDLHPQQRKYFYIEQLVPHKVDIELRLYPDTRQLKYSGTYFGNNEAFLYLS